MGDLVKQLGAGNGAYAPAASASGKADRNDRMSGTVTANSTSWADVDNALDLSLTGLAAGEWVEVGLSCQTGNEATQIFFDVATVVSAATVNHVSGNSAGTSQGVQAWRGLNNVFGESAGSIIYQVQAGDLDAGSLTLRLRYRTSSATNKSIFAGSVTPLSFWGRALG